MWDGIFIRSGCVVRGLIQLFRYREFVVNKCKSLLYMEFEMQKKFYLDKILNLHAYNVSVLKLIICIYRYAEGEYNNYQFKNTHLIGRMVRFSIAFIYDCR
jgi:hypothetical protein